MVKGTGAGLHKLDFLDILGDPQQKCSVTYRLPLRSVRKTRPSLVTLTSVAVDEKPKEVVMGFMMLVIFWRAPQPPTLQMFPNADHQLRPRVAPYAGFATQ
jgi:hypothetical protein